MTSFQDIILKLQQFWAKKGCAIIQPIDIEVGAGTLHPMSVLKAIDDNPFKVAYVQPCRRPTDARFGKNPNRLSHYYQFQVLIKPSEDKIREFYLESLEFIGVDVKNNDIRFVEDDWENPSVGAAGLGWEVWFNGMEITQFTYFQQVGGVECKMVSNEITYGLERIAMHIQNVDNIFDINYNGKEGKEKITYGDIFYESERQNSHFMLENNDKKQLFDNFDFCLTKSKELIEKNLYIPAYELALKASHNLNLLDAGGFLSVNLRASYILKVRNIVNQICLKISE